MVPQEGSTLSETQRMAYLNYRQLFSSYSRPAKKKKEIPLTTAVQADESVAAPAVKLQLGVGEYLHPMEGDRQVVNLDVP